MGKSQSRKLTPDANNANFVRFALVGSSGCGKSAFVNAVRGIDDEEENSATVDVVESELRPIEYTYPENPLVSFCDFPGYGTARYPNVEMYWDKLKLGKFDQFLIFITQRVTQLDLALLEKVKSTNKSFFLIRTKIDIEHMSQNKRSDFKEEEMLSKIRNYVVKQTDSLSCVEEDVFLISSYDPYGWDFFKLIQAIINLFPVPVIDSTTDLTEQYLADARAYVKDKGVANIQEFLKDKLLASKGVKIRFGITGNSGAGKSAFINAIRGLTDRDEGAAKVDVVETTVEPTEYQHPDNPKITFVDLPGIGTPNYPDLPTYCEKVGLKYYDTFLIFTSTRFTNYDMELARKVKEMGKSFFLVRTKIDINLHSESRKKTFNEEETLARIKEDCVSHLKGLISNEKDIFLISNYDTDKWDFGRLIVAIINALPNPQRECLTLSLANLNQECQKRAENVLKVVYQTTKLTSAEIGRMSLRLESDWDNVAGLLDIPYHDREKIRLNFIKSSKAEQVLLHFNESKSFDRHVLETCLYELGRDDLIDIMRSQKSKSSSSLTGNLDRGQTSIMGSLELETRLSSRELYRLSRRIVVDWEILAGLLDISAEDRNIICTDRNYNDVRSRAEKMLLIFNRRAGFSREKLANCFKEIGQLDLIEPILKGQWRSL